ncbi:MAG: hypothetical protein JWL96_3395 [Sphingomonas bacterium]|uniref:hypothetical protein n=1 Tax=Sphingomonas bacterium TaxID=1895847 RepID=UPI00261620A0|nr:hypothetical protein [Sphingomonas bacterium]MDB5711325.1 hypothetical protein [Sphingomonas bacterium]
MVFYAIGVLDFAKNIMPLFTYLSSGTYRSIDYSSDLRPQLFAVFLSAVIYASGWVAYGVITTILLSIHDHIQGLRLSADAAAMGRQGGQDA